MREHWELTPEEDYEAWAKVMDNKLFQTITLVLSDGTECQFTGPAKIPSECRIVDIKITRPTPLPDGLTWESMPTIYKETSDGK